MARSDGHTRAQWKRIMTSAFAMSFVFNLLRLTGPLFMLLVYDRVLGSRSQETLITLFGLMVALLVAMGLFDYARRRLLARLGGQFQEEVELTLFKNRPRGRYFTRNIRKPAEGLDEVDNLRGYLNGSGLVSVLDFFWTPMFVVVIFVLHPILGAVAMGGLAVLVAVSIVRNMTGRAKDERAQASSRRITHLKDMIVASRDTLLGQSMAGSYVKRWVWARREARDDAIELNDWTGAFPVIIRQTRMLLQYSVLATGAYLTLQGKLTVGAMVAATFLVMRVFQPVESFIMNLPATRKALRNWRALREILADHVETAGADDLEALDSRLTLKGVTVKSPVSGQPILKSLSMDVAPGGMIEISGQSGVGKTVLAESILGLWRNAGGSILLGGANIERYSVDQFEARFGYMPERAEFVSGTLEENIARMSMAPDLIEVMKAAELAGIHDTIVALKNGYKTRISARAEFFSKGEQNRLALARALYGSPDILIFDEPDDQLQAAFGGQLKEFVAAHKKRGGIILILSRSALNVAGTNGRLVLRDGRLQHFKSAQNVTRLEDKKKTAASGKST